MTEFSTREELENFEVQAFFSTPVLIQCQVMLFFPELTAVEWSDGYVQHLLTLAELRGVPFAQSKLESQIVYFLGARELHELMGHTFKAAGPEEERRLRTKAEFVDLRQKVVSEMYSRDPHPVDELARKRLLRFIRAGTSRANKTGAANDA